jgi:hypothetical protein
MAQMSSKLNQLNKRVDKLERVAGDDEIQILIVVDWSDTPYWINHERLTKEEFDQKYPDWKPDREVTLDWGDDEDSKVHKEQTQQEVKSHE